MELTAQILKTYIENHIREVLAFDPNAHLRPILLGPPIDVLERLFNTLTAGGSQDWYIDGLGDDAVVVLLVRDQLPDELPDLQEVNTRHSQQCYWYYAVSARNSFPRVLMLVDPLTWDNRPESLANTTEVLGDVSSPYTVDEWLKAPLWNYILNYCAEMLGLQRQTIQWALRKASVEGKNLDPQTGSLIPWQVIERLLAYTETELDPINTLTLAVGLPAANPAIDESQAVRESTQALDALAGFLGDKGLASGLETLKQTQAATENPDFLPALDSLLEHLATSVMSGIDFRNGRIQHFRPDFPPPDWWFILNATSLSQLLAETAPQPQGRIELVVENALNPNKTPKEPWITTGVVELHARVRGEQPLLNPSYSRRNPGEVFPLEPLLEDETRCIDVNPGPHSKPIDYIVSAPNFRAGTASVIVLDSFECGGYARVLDAEANSHPRKSGQEWQQEIELIRAGITDLIIYCTAAADRVRVTNQGNGDYAAEESIVSDSRARSIRDIEHGDIVRITLLDAEGVNVGEWNIHFTVEETGEAAPCQFEALVSAHQSRRGRLPAVRTPDNFAQRLELEYLTNSLSWKPLLISLSTETSIRPDIDWEQELPTHGQYIPQTDPRPNRIPPDAIREAREQVRLRLASLLRPIGEIELDSPDLSPLLMAYLETYSLWLENDPESAVWMDSIAIHDVEWDRQAGQLIPTNQPVVIAISPLHPLKLAWHHLAQRQLRASLTTRCPAAGLLDATSAPDVGAWAIEGGSGQAKWKAFLAVDCKNPHWSLFWNRDYLDMQRYDVRSQFMRQLGQIGLGSMGIISGFSLSQTIDSLNEITRLIPGRATLRVGIIGEEEDSLACTEGIIHWCRQQYGDLSPSSSPFEEDTYFESGQQNWATSGPFDLEIYDLRGSVGPSPEQLANLSEETGERVKWFKIRDEDTPDESILDLIILDQLGTRSPSLASYPARSPVASCGLFRIRLREDYEGGTILRESRMIRSPAETGNLASLFRQVLANFEIQALQDGASHFEFQPNQVAIGNRLQQSMYLAVTSSQVDPGCLIRGTRGQQGYLWDYELPGILGGKNKAGYFLIAKPVPAMKRAIDTAAGLVTQNPPDVDDLLDEISRRGIPVLKRLASGGAQSRGELGLLLAVRLLQDAFRQTSLPPRLPVTNGNCINLILPVDPFEEPFERIRGALCNTETTSHRSDLLVIAIRCPLESPVQIKITPVEVKFRGQSTMSDAELRDALRQAANLGEVLYRAWSQPSPSDLWATCTSALLAQCLDLAFRIYADERVHETEQSSWVKKHEQVLQAVLDLNADVTVDQKGCLIVFDRSENTVTIDMDGDGFVDTVILCPYDAEVLLTGQGSLSEQGDDAVTSLALSFPDCSECPEMAKSNTEALPQNALVNDTEPSRGRAATQPDTSLDVAAPDAMISWPSGQEHLQEPGTRVIAGHISESLRSQVDGAFAGFIGNEAAIELLTNDLLRALLESPPYLPKNYLFTGQPSTGKTELAKRVAAALELPFVKLDGRGVGTRDRLFELIDGELVQQNLPIDEVSRQSGLPVLQYPPLIVFIDEVHLMPRSIQESLLTMLEARDRTVTLAHRIVRMDHATFMFATTRASSVDAAFRSRCSEVQLREYTPEEVAQIVYLRSPADERLKAYFPDGWPWAICIEIARLGRLMPREALSIARDLETSVLVQDYPQLHDHLEAVRRSRRIDELGLGDEHQAYLNILERENRPLGEQAILNMLGTVDRDRVLNEVEPILRRLGFISLGPRGREITSQGREYALGKRRQTRQ